MRNRKKPPLPPLWSGLEMTEKKKHFPPLTKGGVGGVNTTFAKGLLMEHEQSTMNNQPLTIN